MKSHILIATLLGAVGTFSAIDQASMEIDSWCITYLSTYLAPVSNQASVLTSTEREALEPIAQESRKLPLVPSVRPTFGRNTSVPTTWSTLSDDGQGALTLDTSFVSVQSTGTSPVSPISAETSDLNVEPTGVLTNELATSSASIQDLGTTASTDTFPTSSSINQPAGRSIIFRVSIPDNERRGLHKRATGGFVGIDNPDVCTFAAVFTLAEGKLFDGGVPVYYSGEDYKDLAGQDNPSGDSITTTFTTSGRNLVFRNSGLPNGDAGFCQVSNGQVYITFTTGPPGCVPVNLAVYDVEQCQDGRLIGDADLTSTSSETVTSQTVVPQAISSESVTSIEGTSAVEETQPIESESEGTLMPTNTAQSESQRLPIPSSTVQSESFGPVSQTAESIDPTSQTFASADPGSQTSESGTSVMASSGGTDVSAKKSSFITAIPAAETATTQSSIILSISDDSSTEEASSSTEKEDSTSLASISTDLAGLSTIPSVETTIPSTLDMKSETTSSIEMSSIDTTTAIEPETTTSELETTISEPEAPTTDVTTDADVTINTDTTTTEDQSTAEIPAVTEDTTTAAPVPTFVNLACSEVSSPYEDPSGVSFEILCNNQPRGYAPLDNIQVDSFTACVRFCAEDTRCVGSFYLKNVRVCGTFSDSFAGYEATPDIDVALRIPEDVNQITTTGDTATTEDPKATTDATTAAIPMTTAADPVPPFVEATCNEVSSPYDDPIGVSFEVSCDTATYGINLIDAPFGTVFTACVRYCALDDRCVVMYFDRPASLCLLFSDYAGSFPDPQFDGAILISGGGNQVTTDDQTTIENPVTIAEAVAGTTADNIADRIADTTADNIGGRVAAAVSTIADAATTL
ncbi:Ff.00g053890.m01.CDS01 [Fusarium sp. VM40]|nr:Ff.00g053890.m01.CDS01 [Fusarium sp. VM40]